MSEKKDGKPHTDSVRPIPVHPEDKSIHDLTQITLPPGPGERGGIWGQRHQNKRQSLRLDSVDAVLGCSIAAKALLMNSVSRTLRMYSVERVSIALWTGLEGQNECGLRLLHQIITYPFATVHFGFEETRS